jgi:hypothetical protein
MLTMECPQWEEIPITEEKEVNSRKDHGVHSKIFGALLEEHESSGIQAIIFPSKVITLLGSLIQEFCWCWSAWHTITRRAYRGTWRLIVHWHWRKLEDVSKAAAVKTLMQELISNFLVPLPTAQFDQSIQASLSWWMRDSSYAPSAPPKVLETLGFLFALTCSPDVSPRSKSWVFSFQLQYLNSWNRNITYGLLGWICMTTWTWIEAIRVKDEQQKSTENSRCECQIKCHIFR